MEEHVTVTKWHQGEGIDAQFKYIDFEAATEGEYWLVFRGLLLLHRDALVGRFAKQRAAGIGTNIDVSSDLGNRLHKDEFHEPLTVGWLERTIVNCRNLDTTYMEGFVTKEGAVPPPSDYFLGFRSPGTAIWNAPCLLVGSEPCHDQDSLSFGSSHGCRRSFAHQAQNQRRLVCSFSRGYD